MSLFDFILSLLLVLNPGISEADFNNVYSVLDDTSIHSIVVDNSAFDKLSQLGDSGVAPLDLTSQQSGWLLHIMEALYQNGLPSSLSVFDRLTDISNSLGYRVTNSTLYSQLAGITTYLNRSLDSIDSTNSNFFKLFKQLFDVGGYYLRYGNDMLSLTADIRDNLDKLGSAPGWDVPLPDTFFDSASYTFFKGSFSPFHVLTMAYNTLCAGPVIAPNRLLYTTKGPVVTSTPIRFTDYIVQSFPAFYERSFGADGKTAFSFLTEDITQDPTIVEVDNILDALGHMGTQIQNPLQRLAYVFSNPLDLEIKENVTENTESANDNFLKPGSPGSVKPSDIGDAADFASGASDFLQTGASPSDAFSGLAPGSDNWGFFSQQAMDDMLGNPPPSVVSDGELPSDFELGDDGFYHLLPSHLFAVDSKLGKGG